MEQPPSGGTARDFGNMLNEHMPNKKKPKAPEAKFSPWTKMKKKKEKEY